ncbi:hypothetical protein ACVWYQ_004357 [Bradyrhizobium sp. USDA 3397]
MIIILCLYGRSAVACVLEIQTGAMGAGCLGLSRCKKADLSSRHFSLFLIIECDRTIVAIPVKPNVPVKANDVLFQIDPAPFQYKVTQLQASLAGAKQQVEILKSNCEQATANVSHS